MAKNNTYPDWVLKHKVRGTTIKKIGDSYFLYSATSKKVEGKNYPVSVQKYIGVIKPEGLIETKHRIEPDKVEARHLSSLISEIPEEVGDPILINVEGRWYFTKMKESIKRVLFEKGLYKDGELNA